VNHYKWINGTQMKKSGISQIPRGMAENTVEMRKDSAKSGMLACLQVMQLSSPVRLTVRLPQNMHSVTQSMQHV